MAFRVAARRLSSSRNGYSLFSRYCASSAPLVADRIVNITAIDVEGNRHPLKGLTGKSLLTALTSSRLIDPKAHPLDDISACSADCEVSIASEWLDKLPRQSEEELDTLRFAAGKNPLDKHSRLSCQIVLKPELDGIVVALAEPKPWDIP